MDEEVAFSPSKQGTNKNFFKENNKLYTYLETTAYERHYTKNLHIFGIKSEMIKTKDNKGKNK